MPDLASQKLISSQNSSFTTVDDIFTHLTIPQIQKLSKEYKQNIDNAKENLHSLVGSKYRDLIKIAEDIDDMSSITMESNQKIAELSYRSRSFFGFTNKNAFSRFNSLIRSDKADAARKKSEITILRNLIYNKLIKLDLKISSKSKPTITHTSILVYYAKVYYSIQVTFKDLLESNKALNDKFTKLKQRFIDFLVFELARYSVYNSSLYFSKHDRFSPGQRFSANDLIVHQRILNDEDLEQILEEDEDFDDEEPDDKFDDEEYVNVTFESYNRKSLPIVNYLVCFIILNNSNEELNSMQKITVWFLKLRWNYLKETIATFEGSLISQKNSTVNFFNLFKFIENTLVYVNTYFLRPNSELIKELKTYTKPWICTNILGFRGWIKEKIVALSQEEYINPVVLELNPDLYDGIDVVFDFITAVLNKNFDNISELLVIFYNLVISLRNLNHLIVQNDSSSLVIERLNQGDRRNEINRLLILVTDSIFKTYEDHHNALIQSDSPNGILGSIESKLYKTDMNSQESINLYSDELVNLMDENIEQYINIINSISGFNSSQKDNVSRSLRVWFDFFNEYGDAIQIGEESEYGKLNHNNCIAHLHGLLQKSSSDEFKLDLGDFNSEILATEFSKLRESLNQKFWESILQFLGLLKERLNSLNDVDLWYYLLEILSIVKVRTLKFEEDEDNKASAVLDEIIATIYSNIIHNISSEIVSRELLTQTASLDFDEDIKFGDISFRPTLGLSNLMYKVSSFLLSSSLTSENYVFGHLFLNEHFGTIFRKIKNEWIMHDLVDKTLLPALIELSTSQTEHLSSLETDGKAVTERNGSTKPSDKTLKEVQILFANIVYLVQFTEASPIDKTHPVIKEKIAIINEVTELMDTTVVSIIIKGVTEYYGANKNIFLPLLAS